MDANYEMSWHVLHEIPMFGARNFQEGIKVLSLENTSKYPLLLAGEVSGWTYQFNEILESFKIII